MCSVLHRFNAVDVTHGHPGVGKRILNSSFQVKTVFHPGKEHKENVRSVLPDHTVHAQRQGQRCGDRLGDTGVILYDQNAIHKLLLTKLPRIRPDIPKTHGQLIGLCLYEILPHFAPRLQAGMWDMRVLSKTGFLC